MPSVVKHHVSGRLSIAGVAPLEGDLGLASRVVRRELIFVLCSYLGPVNDDFGLFIIFFVVCSTIIRACASLV